MRVVPMPRSWLRQGFPGIVRTRRIGGRSELVVALLRVRECPLSQWRLIRIGGDLIVEGHRLDELRPMPVALGQLQLEREAFIAGRAIRGSQ
jgi:hypothetical protein